MKVVLLQDVRKLGRKFEVKNVTSGYARNFLIPKGLVKIATDGILNELESQRKAWTLKVEEMKASAKKLEEEFASNPLTFSLKTDTKGSVFGSVKAEDIEKKLRELGYEGEVQIEKPIKATGTDEAMLDLGSGVKAKIKVKIEKA